MLCKTEYDFAIQSLIKRTRLSIVVISPCLSSSDQKKTCILVCLSQLSLCSPPSFEKRQDAAGEVSNCWGLKSSTDVKDPCAKAATSFAIPFIDFQSGRRNYRRQNTSMSLVGLSLRRKSGSIQASTIRRFHMSSKKYDDHSHTPTSMATYTK